MVNPIAIFISYAHEDAGFLEELKKSLKPDIRRNIISIWTDENIRAGARWDEVIKAKLREAQVVIFLVSPDFLDSDYINNVELKNARESQWQIIIPIIIRPIEMKSLVLNEFQAIPEGDKAVSQWQNRDEAWVKVKTALSEVFREINGEEVSGRDVNTPGSSHASAKVFNKVNHTDKLVLALIILLLSISVIVFGYGLFTSSMFHISSAAIGIGLGLAGYFMGRKSLSY